jgi:hypothetical protein
VRSPTRCGRACSQTKRVACGDARSVSHALATTPSATPSCSTPAAAASSSGTNGPRLGR